MSSTTERAAPASPALAAVGQRVRQLRRKLGLSVRALALRTDFSASFISQLENGAVSPSLASLEKIAQSAGATLRDLFVEPAAGQPLVVRHGQRQQLTSSWSRARLEALSVAGQHLEAMLIVLEPGGRSGKEPRSQAKEEFALVTEGEVVLTLGEDRHVLRKGDAVVVPAGTPRLLANARARRARVLVVSAR